MKKGLLIGIVVLWVGWVIVAGIQEPGWIMPTLLVGVLLGVWIYFVRMVWKKGTSLFHEEMKPGLATRRLKRLKAFLLVVGTSFAVNFVSSPVGGVGFVLGDEEPVSMSIWFLSIMAFIVAAIGSLVIFLMGRRKTT